MKTAIFKIQAVFILACVVSGYAFGDSGISMNIQPQPLMAGEPAQLELKSADDYPEITEFPEVLGIAWRQGASRSSQINIINFKKTTAYTSIYVFVPQKEGEITIPSLKIQCGKKKSITEPASLKVFGRKFDVDSAGGGLADKKESAKLEDILFIKAIPLTELGKIYVGQEIQFEVRLYFISGLKVECGWPQMNIENVVFKDFSAVNQQNNQFAPHRIVNETVKGQPFNVFIFRTAFRPIVPGNISGKVSVDCRIMVPDENRRRTRNADDQFDDFFSDGFFSSPFSNYRRIDQAISADIKGIEATALPVVPKDSKFLGLVGEWDMKTELSSENLKKGEAVTLKIKGRGDGTLDTLKVPELNFPGFRMYPPEINKGTVTQIGNVSFDANYVLIPLEQGPSEINLDVSFFSPAKGKFIEIPFSKKMNVEKSDNPSAAVVADAGVQKGSDYTKPTAVKANRPDGILYLKKKNMGDVAVPLWKNNSILMLILLILGPLAWLASELLSFRRMKTFSDPILRRKMTALSRKGKIIREISRSETDKINELIQNRVVPFLNDYFGMPPGMSGVELAEKVGDPELSECLRSGADSAYMPGSSKLNSTELKDKLVKVLKKTLVILALFAIPISGFSDDEKVASAKLANDPMEAYDAGKFKETADLYKAELDNHSPDPAILYNYGNCLYQLNELSQALLCYERAHLLAPRDSDILENLNHVRRKLMLPEYGKSETPKELILNLRDSLRPDEWMLIALGAWTIAGIILALRRKYFPVARLLLVLSVAGFIFALGLISSLTQINSSYSHKLGIVTQRNVPVYFLPSENSRQAEFKLSSGENVKIEEERHEWLRVRAGNAEGWIHSYTLSKLWP